MVAYPELFVGCSSGGDDPWCRAIKDFAPKMGRHVIPAGCATHAFVVISHDDGLAERIDCRPPHTEMLPCDVLDEHTNALWQVQLAREQTKHGISEARLHAKEKRPYDLAGVAAQAVPALRSWTGIPGCEFCTELVLDVLTACDGPAADFARRVRAGGAHPERLVYMLEEERVWWLRKTVGD